MNKPPIKKSRTLRQIQYVLEAKTIKDEKTGCWLYQGKPHNDLGHCKINYNGKRFYIHRISAHIHWNFDLDSIMLICHKEICSHPSCWNPEHLYEGSHFDNTRDSIVKGTFKNVIADAERLEINCKYGHPLDGLRENGKRYCKTCNRIRAGYL